MVLLRPQIEEFYENGLYKVLFIIPKNLEEEERLLIESIVFTAYGYFRSYVNLEKLLEENTSDVGEIPSSYHIQRDAFGYAWSLVDLAYAVLKLAQLPVGKRLLKLSEETLGWLEPVSSLRNYMDHLPANFRNAAHATRFSPLFGMLTYQMTPALRDAQNSPRVVYVTGLGSTHLKDTFSFQLNDCISEGVLSSIDNIMLHVRKNDRANLSRILANLTLDLNRFSMDIQTYLTDLLQKEDFEHGGLRIPFPVIIAKGDLEGEISRYDIKTPLDHDKIRVEVHLEPPTS
jgi:hypothetical protein